MSKVSKAAKKAVDKAFSIPKAVDYVAQSRPLKKAPAKREMLPQTTACGMVAVGAPNIPPINHNKKKKL